jgi:hypothetical protein
VTYFVRQKRECKGKRESGDEIIIIILKKGYKDKGRI